MAIKVLETGADACDNATCRSGQEAKAKLLTTDSSVKQLHEGNITFPRSSIFFKVTGNEIDGVKV